MEENDYKYYLDNGIHDIRDGNFEAGIEKINKSIELKNDWEIPYFYRAVAHQALDVGVAGAGGGDGGRAMLDYTKALQLNEKMTDAYYNRARILLTRKDIPDPDVKKAVEDLEKAIEQDEKFIDALYAIAAAHKKLGNYETALDYLEKLLKIEPEAIHARALKKLLLQKYL